jgi:phosphoenolpyruvate synthase/pyruvate phosphate dikinase
MSQYCLPFSAINRHDVPLAGGKGANLGDMVQAGLPVPPGFVITSAAYRKMFASSGLDVRSVIAWMQSTGKITWP